MLKSIPIAMLLSIAFVGAADARHRHPHHSQPRLIVCNERGCSQEVKGTRTKIERTFDANGNIIGRRPAGCPHAFCGCEASRFLFGAIHPELNLASNWIRKFPRTAPAPGMAAVRNHHVMVLMSHVSGSDWLVHDGNSGDGLTREHVRSISGYVIVDPQRSRLAAQLQ